MAGLPFEMRAVENKGMGMFATRDIEAGELILQELPLVRLPSQWGLRDLRTALQEKPWVEEHFNALYSWSESTALRTFWSNIQQMVRDGIILGEAERDKLIRQGLVFKSNDFHMEDSRAADNYPGTVAVFRWASRFNHSCDPNMRYSLCWSPGFFTSRAKRDIKAGEEITINYCSILWPVRKRQCVLLEGWGFMCRCSACTEDGTRLDEARDQRESLRNMEVGDEVTGPEADSVFDKGLRDDTVEENEPQYERFRQRITFLEAKENDAELYFIYSDAAELYFGRYRANIEAEMDEEDPEENQRKADQARESWDTCRWLYEAAYNSALRAWGDADPIVAGHRQDMDRYAYHAYTMMGVTD